MVVDIDNKNGGLGHWEIFEEEHNLSLETPTVRTGGGGFHIYFEQPDSLEIRNSTSKLADGIDIRADGGYVVLPPSKTEKPYEYDMSPDTPLEPIPEGIINKLNGQVNGRTPVAEKLPAIVTEGTRHSTMIELAGALRNSGLTRNEIEAALIIVKDQRFAEGTHTIKDEEIFEAAEWVSKKQRGFQCSDLGNAERFIDQHGENIRYCYDIGGWLVWDGKRWNKNVAAKIEQLAYLTARSIYNEATNSNDPDKRKKLGKWAVQSEAKYRIQAMVDLARAFRPVTLSELDNHSMLLNCRNGVVDLVTGKLLAHNKDYFLTKMVDADFESDAECPKWAASLDLITGGDKHLQYYLQKVVGYSLTGNTDEHAVFFLYGAGNNGKSTFVETLIRLFGEYAQRTKIESLLSSWTTGDTASPYVASLAGARFVVASEIPSNRKLNESLIKDLSGGDQITARFLHQNPFSFSPSHKLFLVGNYRPRITGDDLGIWRRMQVIPFNVTIPPDKQRRMSDVLADFEEESNGILTWAVLGSIYWKTEGLRQPDAVATATSEYKTEEDLLQSFLDDICEMHPDYVESKQALYLNWKTWTANEGEKEAEKFSKRWLTQRLSKRGFEPCGDGRASLAGLRIRPRDFSGKQQERRRDEA